MTSSDGDNPRLLQQLSDWLIWWGRTPNYDDRRQQMISRISKTSPMFNWLKLVLISFIWWRNPRLLHQLFGWLIWWGTTSNYDDSWLLQPKIHTESANRIKSFRDHLMVKDFFWTVIWKLDWKINLRKI